MGWPTQNMKKNCLQCAKEVFKKQNCSLNSWRNRVKYCSVPCRRAHMVGKKASIETRKKMAIAHIGNKSTKGTTLTLEHRLRVSESLKGSNHWNWQGGKTSFNRAIRNSFEYKLWREAVFTRDNWTCQGCSYRGGDLHADHIKPFALFPELRTAIDNGQTLCVDCHKKTPTFSGRNFNEYVIVRKYGNSQ